MHHSPSRIRSRGRLVAASLVLSLLSAVQSATAATLFWDPGLTPSTPSGGTGTWNTAANWSNGASDIAWPNVAANDDKAIFGGSAGTVTLGAARTAGGVRFDTSGYTLSGSSVLTVNVQTGTQPAPGLGFAANTGVDNISVSLPVLVLTSAGSGVYGALTNTDKINFNNTIVAYSGSRQMVMTNSSALATTSVTNWSVTNGTSNANVSLWLEQGNLTITNFAAGVVTNSAQAAWNSASNGEFNLRGSGAGTLTLSGNNTLLNNAGAGALNIALTNANATLALGHDNALGARDAGNALTDTGLLLNGGTVTAINGARNIANNVTLGGNAAIGGANALTLSGNFTQSGSRTLTVNNSATTTLSGNVFLANDNVTSRTLTLTGTGDTTISGNIANNNAGNTVASGLTKNGLGTLTLSGASTYSGNTTINAGVFLVDGTHTVAAGATGAYTVASGATLGGTGAIDLSAANQSVTLADGALLHASSADSLVFTLGAGTLDLSGALANASASMLFTLGAPGSTVISASHATIGAGLLNFDDFDFTTGVGFGAGAYTLFDLGSIGGSLGTNLTGTVGGLDVVISLDGTDIILTASAIPEPSAFAAFASLAGLALAAARRRRS